MDVGLVLVVGGALILALMALVSNARTRRAFSGMHRHMITEARGEVREHISVMAQRILELSDRVDGEDHERAEQLYDEATSTYAEAKNKLEGALSFDALEDICDDLNRARWKLDSAGALLDGQEPPDEPADHAACFFDATHGSGGTQADLETPAGKRSVPVCTYCADKLREGRAPHPRMVEVHGHRIPQAMAPRAYGGAGLIELEEFTVVVGGQPVPFGWGDDTLPRGRRFSPERSHAYRTGMRRTF